MTYSTSNPPQKDTKTVADSAPTTWKYTSADALSSVIVAGYITNAKDLGMKVNDLVFVTQTGVTPPVLSVTNVAAISAAGAADLGTGTVLSSTNST